MLELYNCKWKYYLDLFIHQELWKIKLIINNWLLLIKIKKFYILKFELLSIRFSEASIILLIFLLILAIFWFKSLPLSNLYESENILASSYKKI
jgi:hypothetical protein